MRLPLTILPLAILGGPSYRMEVDVRHAVSMGYLATALRVTQGIDVAFSYLHRTPVAMARNELFRHALQTEAKVLFWLDSDCSFGARDPVQFAMLIEKFATENMRAAMMIFPTEQRDGRMNIWTGRRPGERWEKSDYSREIKGGNGKFISIYAGGFGGVMFRLDWYRKNWSNAPHFMDRVDPSDGGYMSEDFVHCALVREAGGSVLGSALMVDHIHRGGHKE